MTHWPGITETAGLRARDNDLIHFYKGAVLRRTANGALDKSFGSNGVFLPPYSEFTLANPAKAYRDRCGVAGRR